MSQEQPAPKRGQGDVWAEVIEAERSRPDPDPRLIERWEARRRVGIERYGVPLGRGDGRDEWRDLLEELDDAVAYAARLRLDGAVDTLRDLLRGSRSEAVALIVVLDAMSDDDPRMPQVKSWLEQAIANADPAPPPRRSLRDLLP